MSQEQDAFLRHLDGLKRANYGVALGKFPNSDKDDEANPLFPDMSKRDWLRLTVPAPKVRYTKIVRNPYGPSLASIMEVVSDCCRVGKKDMMSRRRAAHIVRARHIMYFVAAELTNQSLPQISRFLDGRDHTTILHGIRKVKALRHKFEPELSEVLERISPKKDAA